MSDDEEDSKKPASTGGDGLIGSKKDDTDLVGDSDDDGHSLIGDVPAHADLLHMNRPSDEELGKQRERNERGAAAASAAALSLVLNQDDDDDEDRKMPALPVPVAAAHTPPHDDDEEKGAARMADCGHRHGAFSTAPGGGFERRQPLEYSLVDGGTAPPDMGLELARRKTMVDALVQMDSVPEEVHPVVPNQSISSSCADSNRSQDSNGAFEFNDHSSNTGNEQLLPIAAKLATEDESETEIYRRVTAMVRQESLHSQHSTVIAEMVVVSDEDKQLVGTTTQNWGWIVGGAALVVLVGLVVGMAVTSSDRSQDPEPPEQHAPTAPSQCALVNYPEVVALNETMRPADPILALADDTICYERLPLQGYSVHCPPQPLGSGITNLVAQSQLWYVPEADLALVNAGLVKTDVCAGDFTLEMAHILFPYDSKVVTLHDVPGSTLVAVLEEALEELWHEYSKGHNAAGGYPYCAGLRFDVDMTAEFPNRLSHIQVNSQMAGNWIPLDANATYSIVTNSFLAEGGDFYATLAKLFVDQGDDPDGRVIARDVFIEYIHEHLGQVLHIPPPEEYSTQHYVHDPRLFNISST